MKKSYIYMLFAMMTVLLAGLSSCSETNDEEEEFPDWKNRNEQYFSKAYTEARQLVSSGSKEWKVIRSATLNEDVATHDYDNIVVKVLTEGTGSGCPMYTDSVKVHYSGRLIPSTTYADGYVFDQSWTGDYNLETMMPRTFAVGGVVKGFSTALQNMHIGDRWQVTMPYQLGYDSDSTPGAAYSTLIFDVTLVGYFRVAAPSAVQGANGKTKAQPKGEWIYE